MCVPHKGERSCLSSVALQFVPFPPEPIEFSRIFDIIFLYQYLQTGLFLSFFLISSLCSSRFLFDLLTVLVGDLNDDGLRYAITYSETSETIRSSEVRGTVIG